MINGADFVIRILVHVIYAYEGNKMHSWENDDVLSGGPLNHIHQNTKSARLIAMCERSLKGKSSEKWNYFYLI